MQSRIAKVKGVSTSPKSSSTSASDPPHNWPTEVQYLALSSSPSAGLAAQHADIFCSPVPISSPYHPSTLRSQGWTEIRPITSTGHPAYGQRGLFAKRSIPPRTVLLPYFGIVHTDEESDVQSEYDLGIWISDGERDVRLGIDATERGNEARFVNDYRGIAQRANIEFQELLIPRQQIVHDKKSETGGSDITTLPPLRGLFFQSGSREIKAGVELLTSYGKGFWAARRVDQGDTETEEEKTMTQIGYADLDGGGQGQPGPSDAHTRPPGTSHVQAMLQRQRARLEGMKIAR